MSFSFFLLLSLPLTNTLPLPPPQIHRTRLRAPRRLRRAPLRVGHQRALDARGGEHEGQLRVRAAHGGGGAREAVGGVAARGGAVEGVGGGR